MVKRANLSGRKPDGMHATMSGVLHLVYDFMEGNLLQIRIAFARTKVFIIQS